MEFGPDDGAKGDVKGTKTLLSTIQSEGNVSVRTQCKKILHIN